MRQQSCNPHSCIVPVVLQPPSIHCTPPQPSPSHHPSVPPALSRAPLTPPLRPWPPNSARRPTTPGLHPARARTPWAAAWRGCRCSCAGSCTLNRPLQRRQWPPPPPRAPPPRTRGLAAAGWWRRSFASRLSGPTWRWVSGTATPPSPHTPLAPLNRTRPPSKP